MNSPLSECRFPFQKYPVVTLAHGAGGRFTQHLIDDVFAAALAHAQVSHDGAELDFEARTEGGGKLVMTTDSFVVKPLQFPGGDIGSLGVTGTCNDLAMCGAQPEALSCGWIIEEGFATETLYRLACSMAKAAAEVGARVVTGDTKVVERGHGDGVYLNVTGIGRQLFNSHPREIANGDAIVLSGDIGRHGCAVLAQREDLRLHSTLLSDCAHLWPSVRNLLPLAESVHCLRDLTRGGLATALIELGQASGKQLVIDGGAVPVSDGVSSVCELLGLDPLYVANEGRLVAVVADSAVAGVMARLGGEAVVIGRVQSGEGVIERNALGASRVLDLLSGEQLPRIC